MPDSRSRPAGAGGAMSRRGFVRAATWASSAMFAGGVVGCRPSGTGDDPSLTALTDRPILTRWADGIVQVEVPARELPVAYVSMEKRVVFVDPEYRDRASWLLRAHISVSTWHWRIPLPGDPEGVPIAPGDEAREFEELSIREWDPDVPPAMDDIRIRRGRPVARRLSLDCAELAGVRTVEVESADASADTRPLEAWIQGGPFDLVVSDESKRDTVREDFRLLGTALRFRGRSCTGSGEAVQIAGWAVRAEHEDRL